MNQPDVCIFHSPCADGFTAAWAIWKRWPDVEFIPGVYGQDPPDVAGKDVLIVDFSYKRPVLEEMAKSARTITVIDHHASAERDLAPFVRRLEAFDTLAELSQFGGYLPIQALFDMDKSGAMLAWEYAHPGAEPPELVDYVQDRDLWRFDLHGTREVAAVLFSHVYDFEVWDALAGQLSSSVLTAILLSEGEAIERKHHKDVEELLRMTTRSMVIGGHVVKVANLPYTMASDAAGKLAEDAPFGACYFDNADGKRVFSLRSKPGGADVSLIAAGYGGGGHKHASGFTMPKGWEGDQ